MEAHDQRLAAENTNWESLTANETLARLEGFLLRGKGCQCEEWLLEVRFRCFGQFGEGAIPLLISALRD
jgi:hypothetical protein